MTVPDVLANESLWLTCWPMSHRSDVQVLLMPSRHICKPPSPPASADVSLNNPLDSRIRRGGISLRLHSRGFSRSGLTWTGHS